MADAIPNTMPTRQKDLSRRNVLVALTAPLMAPHIMGTVPAFTRKTLPPHSPTVLPFVTDATMEERSAGVTPRSFWSVVPTGNYGADCDTGAAYAALALDYMAAARSPQILQWSVFDMISMGRVHSGIEVGFMSVFGKIAMNAHARGHRTEGDLA